MAIRGSALLLAIFFIMLLFLIAVALFRVIPTEMHSAGRSRQDMQAHYACSAGTKHAAAWLAAVLDTGASGIGNDVAVRNEPFRMDLCPQTENIAYRNPGNSVADASGYTTDGSLSRFNGVTGADFDGVSFGSKPFLRITQDLHVGQWAVRVWIFPDRQTFPVPEWATVTGATSVLKPADSKIAMALRYYTVVTEAYPFGDPDTTRPRMRSKVTIGQVSAGDIGRGSTTPTDIPYTAVLNTKTIAGRFHTNGFFRIRPASSSYFNPSTAWNGTSSFDRLTYSGAPEAGDPDVVWSEFTNKDGVAYKGGNYQGGDNAYLPWDSSGNNKPNAYEKLAGGRANVNNVRPISLPKTTADLALASWGFETPNPVVGPDGGATGVFVKNDGTKVEGGVYLKGDTREAVLGVADASGAINFSETAVTQSGNPAQMFQQTQAVTAALNPPIEVVTPSTSVTFSQTGQTVYPTSTVTNSVQTGSHLVTGSNVTPTAWNTTYTPQTNYTTRYSTQYTTTVTTVGGGGGYGNDATVTLTTGSSLIPTQTITNVATITNSTAVGWRTTSVTTTVRDYSYSYTPQYTTQALGFNTTSTVNITNTISQSKFYPVDRVIEVTDTPTIIPTTYGGKVLAQNGVPITAPLSVGTGNVVIIKDSRTNGQQAEVQVLSGKLNGVIYSEDNINNLHGVNKGQHTLATSLGESGVSNGKNISLGIPVGEDLVQPNGAGTRVAGSFKYPNNKATNRDTHNNNNPALADRADLLQWGTTPGQDSATSGNTLGLVAQRVGMNIQPRDLQRVYQNNPNATSQSGRPPLRLYAIILAGRGSETDDDSSVNKMTGGFRIFNLADQTDGVDMRNGKRTIDNNQYGYFKLHGNLLERKGAANWTVPAGQSSAKGWDVQLAFDRWGARVPPPFFPTLSEFAAQLYIEEFPNATYQNNQ